ncbi:MAG: [Fe-Fe] hydrogenase large subunit C-terminal domain-containing protein [Bacillota bacterium]
MTRYFHSVRLDQEKCKGCTNCIKRCPTEAIRVSAGKARIMEERCVDCGECIRICPNKAKLAVTDPMDLLSAFDYSVALPAPSFMGQFKTGTNPAQVAGALVLAGFDDVFEVSAAADVVTAAILDYLDSHPQPRPVISSACPAVVRLVQVKYAALVENIIPVLAPMEVAARIAKRRAFERGITGRVGAFFITPCPAKVTASKQPVGVTDSSVDGIVSMNECFALIRPLIEKAEPLTDYPRGSRSGVGWGRAGGEMQAVGVNSLAVDGIHNVITVLNEVERGRLGDLDFIEAQACVGGCVGGCLTVENPFVSRIRVRKLAESSDPRPFSTSGKLDVFRYTRRVTPRLALSLDTDLSQAIAKMNHLEATEARLPGLDCGSCGSPSCRALAEDIVNNRAYETDCIFKLRERVHQLAEEMVDLASKVPPAMAPREIPSSRKDDAE